ncbi:MAG: hypothetical protein IJ054_09520 [Lachnospiraceae bacterium]|nr:hypothetical protein [Lachnospiraceae bacterium]
MEDAEEKRSANTKRIILRTVLIIHIILLLLLRFFERFILEAVTIFLYPFVLGVLYLYLILAFVLIFGFLIDNRYKYGKKLIPEILIFVIGLVLRMILNDSFLYYIDAKVNNKARMQIVENIEQGYYGEKETIIFYNKLFHTHEDVHYVHYPNQGEDVGVFFCTFGWVDESIGFLYELNEVPPKDYNEYYFIDADIRYDYGDNWAFVLLQ